MGMWNELLAKVANVRAPLETDADGVGEIILTVSSTSDRWEIPTWLAGRYCEFTAHGASVDVLFGDSAVDVEYGNTSTIDTEAIAADATTGRRIVDGTTRHWIVPAATVATHFAAEASGDGTLHIGIASVRIGR